MAGGIDTSKFKPRRLRGTPALKFQKKLSLSILAGAVAIALIYSNLPFVKAGKDKLFSEYFVTSEATIDKRLHFQSDRSFIEQRSSKEIKRIMEESKKIHSER